MDSLHGKRSHPLPFRTPALQANLWIATMSVSTWFPCPTFFTILRLCASIITICHGRGRAVLSRLAKLIFNFFYFLFISFFVCLLFIYFICELPLHCTFLYFQRLHLRQFFLYLCNSLVRFISWIK